MNDPIAFFITLTTYGTWLPGDQRGWIEYRKGWQLPDPTREMEARVMMNENAKVLTPTQRKLVELQVRETCSFRNWICHAVNCRTNHLHVVVGAFETPPKKVRADLKAWCTRRLKEDAMPVVYQNWWADRGSVRWVFDDEGLDQVVRYTAEGQ